MATQKLEQVRSDRWQRVPWHRSPLLVLRLTSLPSRFSKILPAPGSTCAPCLRQRDPLQSIDVTVLLLSSSSRSGSRNYPTRFVFALRAFHRVFHLPSPTILIISPVLSLLDHSINTYVITSRRIRHSILIYIYIYISFRISDRSTGFQVPNSLERIFVDHARNETSPFLDDGSRLDPRSLESSPPSKSVLSYPNLEETDSPAKMLPHYRLFRRARTKPRNGVDFRNESDQWAVVRRLASRRLNLTPEQVSVRWAPMPSSPARYPPGSHRAESAR